MSLQPSRRPCSHPLYQVIYRFAGRDASTEYNEVHAPSLIRSTLPAKDHIGNLDASTVTEAWTRANSPPEAEPGSAPESAALPPLSSIINLDDFALAAERSLPAKAWAYISSGSNANITRDANSAVLQRILLRPRVLRPVGAVRTATALFGSPLALPLYISPMGAARTGGPGAELDLARAAAARGIGYCFATPASHPHGAIIDAFPAPAPGAPGALWFQLYMDRDRAKSAAALARVAAAPGKVRAVLLTVDLPVVSKREADERVRMAAVDVNANTGVAVGVPADGRGGGFARRTGAFIDPDLGWADVAWARRAAGGLPLLLKGVQTAEDARRALEAGVDGIVLSNHGGRAADTAAPAILTLLELHRCCPEVLAAMPVLVDGGFRRGSDVVKALCLGAAAVGIGRPFMYALGYGQEGVEHAIDGKFCPPLAGRGGRCR